MSCVKPGAFFLLVLNILISNSAELRVSSMFSIRDELNDIMFQHALLFQTSAHTLSECSLLCVNLVSCTSFQIHPQQMLCRLYWTHFLLDLIGIPSTGWRTYSDNGPCHKGHYYTRQFQYCLRYAGHTFQKSSAFQTCNDRNETLLKIDSAEENLFVSSLAYSFINNTLGTKTHELIIDGEKSSDGKWLSLFGDRSELKFTNFWSGDIESVGEGIIMMPYTNGELKGYEWKSVPLYSNQRIVFCGYHP
ncbi:uncharacterized protein LOC125660321 [Ostrea edulis]|uniref:uncharacterized protein LOC125660321 n=1 Tax=Ostrea edulis TaxID=37623 RepID=UPI0024AF5056|nr:uncharacterized protein LOC125660321 [Ostrea edulis]